MNTLYRHKYKLSSVFIAALAGHTAAGIGQDLVSLPILVVFCFGLGYWIGLMACMADEWDSK